MTTFVKQAMTGAAEASSRRMATMLTRRRMTVLSIVRFIVGCSLADE
jgi:hypothetical protein